MDRRLHYKWAQNDPGDIQGNGNQGELWKVVRKGHVGMRLAEAGLGYDEMVYSDAESIYNTKLWLTGGLGKSEFTCIFS